MSTDLVNQGMCYLFLGTLKNLTHKDHQHEGDE